MTDQTVRNPDRINNREFDRKPFIPPPISKIEDTGISGLWLQDVALKVLYYQGYLSGFMIAVELCLPFPGVVEQLVEILKREKLTEGKNAQNAAPGEGAYVYGLTGLGIER